MRVVDTLDYSMHLDDVEAYILTMPNHAKSLEFSKRCQKSCEMVGQPYKVWYGFDGTSGKIVYPEHLENQTHYSFLKQLNNHMTVTEVAAVMSHYSAWAECVKIDRPIIVLEHDAIMVQKYISHDGWNQINYLGNLQQFQEGKFATFPIHSIQGDNYRFINRAHAYALDPAAARSLIAHLVRFGLSSAPDMLIRVDLFPIVQTGFYAYDLPGETTILDRDGWETKSKDIFNKLV
jgi:GR25 family glycosyltransferase involved in LPS biosynthesis